METIKSGVGRPNKKGLDYFAHSIKHSDEENIIFQQFGCIGYTVYYTLREKVTENGYYYELTERKIQLICSQFHIEIAIFNEILSFMMELELFDKVLFKKYGILTSEQLQIYYVFSASRRTKIYIIQEYCMVTDVVLYKEFSDSKPHEKITLYSISDDNNLIDGNTNSQSKVKENKRKEKKSESKEIKKEKVNAKENGKGYERGSTEGENKGKPLDVSELNDEEYKALFHQ